MTHEAKPSTKILCAKVALLFAMLAAMQWLLGPIATSWHRPPIVDEVAGYQSGANEIVYLGDSTLVEWEQTGDPDTPTILDGLMPDYRVRSIAHAAYAAPMYDAIVERLLREGARPALIIAPINLRTFAPIWQRDPAYQFAKEQLFLKHDQDWFAASFVPAAAFGGYNLAPADQHEFSRIIAPIHQEQEPDAKFARLAEASFMHEVEKDDPYLTRYASLAERCRDAGIPLLLYITPVDIDAGSASLGQAFRSRIFANVDTARSVLQPTSVNVLSLVDLLESNQFRKQSTYPEDHPNVAGRTHVAEKLAKFAQDLLDAAP